MDKPQRKEIVELDIEDIGFEGSGIGKTAGNYAVFVPYTLPGDTVQAKILKNRKNLAEAKLVKICKPSEHRVQPDCSYFGLCNGCRVQHISYTKQLEYKHNNVINAFTRIGNFSSLNINSIIGADRVFFYRNKLEFSFSSNRWLEEEDFVLNESDKKFALGFHKPGFIDKVIDIEKCLLQSGISNNILNYTRDYFKSRNIPAYSNKTNDGFLRYLIIRQSMYKDDLMVNIITTGENHNLVNGYFYNLKDIIKNSAGETDNYTFVHSVSSRKANVAQADNYNVIAGKGFIEEKLGEYKFKIAPFTFFQTNTAQCSKLFEEIINIGNFNAGEKVLDLYCGCGAISIYISGYVKSVHGVEISGEAISSANENARLNGVKNCSFETDDVKDHLKNLIDKKGLYDTIILDPPRSGIHPKAAEYILNLEPAKIMYISCNPSTQARDIRQLSEKYNITAMQPVDMFPQTFHIENIARLDLMN